MKGNKKWIANISIFFVIRKDYTKMKITRLIIILVNLQNKIDMSKS